MLIDQIGYLSSMIDRADQRPGRDAFDRYEALHREVDDCRAFLDAIRGGH
jgi:hypothetical protein